MMNRVNRRRGTASVEFALVVPLLLSILFGTVELGAAFKDLLVVQSAARTAVRSAAIGALETDINNSVLAALPTLHQENVEVQAIYMPPASSQWYSVATGPGGTQNDAPEGSQVRVIVRYDHPLITGKLFSRLCDDPDGSSIQMSGQATMRRE